MNTKRDIPEADAVDLDIDPDSTPLEWDYCGELWCRGRCDPEPEYRMDFHGTELP
jgi:hypothetical protein